jgi:hypothetical protein
METKSTFDDWFYQLEAFSLKSERFFKDCEHYLNYGNDVRQKEAEKVFLSWLKAAFEAGQESKVKS